jgi:hypothetical protein
MVIFPVVLLEDASNQSKHIIPDPSFHRDGLSILKLEASSPAIAGHAF